MGIRRATHVEDVKDYKALLKAAERLMEEGDLVTAREKAGEVIKAARIAHDSSWSANLPHENFIKWSLKQFLTDKKGNVGWINSWRIANAQSLGHEIGRLETKKEIEGIKVARREAREELTRSK